MKTGIVYKATSLTSDKIYVGITTYTLEHRIGRHLYIAFNKNISGYNRKFCKAIRRYGKDDFVWDIIYKNIPKGQLGCLEVKIIKKYNSYINGYNSTSGGKTNFSHSDETKKKISAANKGKKLSKIHRENLSKSKKGQTISEEHKYKLHAGRRGKKNSKEHNAAISAAATGKTHSPESRAKISAAGIGRTHSLESRAKMSKHRKGEDNRNSKLTWHDVQTIREKYTSGKISYSKLAREYKVDKSTIGSIIRKQTWSDS